MALNGCMRNTSTTAANIDSIIIYLFKTRNVFSSDISLIIALIARRLSVVRRDVATSTASKTENWIDAIGANSPVG